MVEESIRALIRQETADAIIFNNPSYDKSIVGFDTQHRLVYDYHRMIQELMSDEHLTEDEAISFIDYNTLRALPYIPESVRPIVITRF